MSTAQPQPDFSAATEPPRVQGRALAGVIVALLLAQLLAALDQTIVGTALPKILSDLNGSNLLQWVGTAYLLSSATLVPIIGKVSDMFGRKWLLVGSVIVFLVGSALCGAAQSMEQLIAFRAFQGLGAAGLFGLTFTLVGDIFPAKERAKWQGIFASVFGLASVFGPLIGGWLTDNASWRWVFYVNLPVGAFALIALVLLLPSNISVRTYDPTKGNAWSRVDFIGAILSAGATVCLLLGLSFGSNGPTRGGYEWGSPQVIGLSAAALVLFVAFFVYENFAAEPILPLKLLKNRVVAVGIYLAFVQGMAFLSVVYYLPTFIQGVLGQAATNSGIVITPLTFTLIIAAIISGRVISRVGRYKAVMVVGGVLLLIGVFLLTRITADVNVLTVSAIMLVMGLGLGCLLPTVTLAVQNAVQRRELGVATGAVTYVRSLGSTFGIAIFGSILSSSFQSELSKHLPTFPPAIPPPVVAVLTNPDILQRSLTTGTGANGLADAILQRGQLAAIQAVPSGPAHDAIVAKIVVQFQQLVEPIHQIVPTIYNTAREALGTAIINGFGGTFVVCLFLLVGTFFMKDIPLLGDTQRVAQREGVTATDEQPAEPIGLAGLGE